MVAVVFADFEAGQLVYLKGDPMRLPGKVVEIEWKGSSYSRTNTQYHVHWQDEEDDLGVGIYSGWELRLLDTAKPTRRVVVQCHRQGWWL